METTPEPAAPSTEELADLEAEFARLESELAALDAADATDVTDAVDVADVGVEPPDSTEGASA